MPAPRSHFEAELRAVIAERIEALRDILENRNTENIAEIKLTIGRLNELRGMDGLIDLAYERIDKRNS